MTRADLDRLKTMRTSFFGLLSENYKRTTVLEKIRRRYAKIQAEYLVSSIDSLMFSHLCLCLVERARDRDKSVTAGD